METNLLPGFEGVAPAVAVDVRADPSAGAAVEVEEVGGGVHEAEALFGDGEGVLRGDPDEGDCVVAECEVEVEHHLCTES